MAMLKRPLRWFAILLALVVLGAVGFQFLSSLLVSPAPGQTVFRDESLFHRLLPGLARAHDLRALNKGNIRFYGRVVDQFGEPVPGAMIDAEIEYFRRLHAWPSFKHVTNLSDSNGCFAIDGQDGFHLVLTPRKSGYALASTNRVFAYSGMSPTVHRPDSNRPVVLKLWKLQGGEPLMKIEQSYSIPFSRQPACIDLMTAQVRPGGGDLRFTFSRPDGLVDERHREKWGVVIDVPEGGVIESEEYYTVFRAPAAGYQPAVRREFDAASGEYQLTWTTALFFRSRGGGVHGKVLVSVRINQAPDQPLYIGLTGVANTNGSRNWEASAPKELLP